MDNVDIQALAGFDYAALGHIHGAQKVKEPWVRYCGTLLKYSVSEWKQEKALLEVTLKGKGKSPNSGSFRCRRFTMSHAGRALSLNCLRKNGVRITSASR